MDPNNRISLESLRLSPTLTLLRSPFQTLPSKPLTLFCRLQDGYCVPCIEPHSPHHDAFHFEFLAGDCRPRRCEMSCVPADDSRPAVEQSFAWRIHFAAQFRWLQAPVLGFLPILQKSQC